MKCLSLLVSCNQEWSVLERNLDTALMKQVFDAVEFKTKD